jgi:zinc protease
LFQPGNASLRLIWHHAGRLLHHLGQVLALRPEQVNAEAKKAILPDRLVWVVVGDMSKVEADIRELNLGEVHKIDADGNALK